MSHEIVIVGGHVATPGGWVDLSIGIDGGRIAGLGDRLTGSEEIDARGLWVLPGAVDAHTHMEAPAFGRQSRDSFETGTRAAAAGGVTTIVDFTLGGGQTTVAEQIAARTKAIHSVAIDVSLHAEIAGWRSDRGDELTEALRMGVPSFKLYTVYAERSDSGQLLGAFRAIAAVGGVAMVHAEDDAIIRSATTALSIADRGRMTAFPRSRPAIAESLAVEAACHLAEVTGVRLHVAHVSTAAGADVVRRAKARGVRVTAETCPHYLLLDERVYAGPDARQFSVIPPLRSASDAAGLWEALFDGTIDTVATDHCPFSRDDKLQANDVLEVPCGLPGVETLLPLMHSEGVARRGRSVQWLTEVLCERPARIFGLAARKGGIRVGADADLVLFDPEAEWKVTAAALHMKTDFSPYEGLRVRGRAVRTLCHGRTVALHGVPVPDAAVGELLSARIEEPPTTR